MDIKLHQVLNMDDQGHTCKFVMQSRRFCSRPLTNSCLTYLLSFSARLHEIDMHISQIQNRVLSLPKFDPLRAFLIQDLAEARASRHVMTLQQDDLERSIFDQSSPIRKQCSSLFPGNCLPRPKTSSSFSTPSRTTLVGVPSSPASPKTSSPVLCTFAIYVVNGVKYPMTLALDCHRDSRRGIRSSSEIRTRKCVPGHRGDGRPLRRTFRLGHLGRLLNYRHRYLSGYQC